MFVVTSVLTQGRFGNGRGQEYAEAFKIKYWRPGMTNFKDPQPCPLLFFQKYKEPGTCWCAALSMAGVTTLSRSADVNLDFLFLVLYVLSQQGPFG